MIEEILTKKNFIVLKSNPKQPFNYLAFKSNAVLLVLYKTNKKLTAWKIKPYQDQINQLIELDVPHNFIKEFWLETKLGIYRIDIVKPTDIDFLEVY